MDVTTRVRIAYTIFFVCSFVQPYKNESVNCQVRVPQRAADELEVDCQMGVLNNETRFPSYLYNATRTTVVLKLTCTADEPSELHGVTLLNVFSHDILKAFSLSIIQCNLTNLANEFLAGSGMDRLTELSLINCHIVSLENSVFCCTTSLKLLILDYNNITEIPDYLFANLSNLSTLYVRYNNIRKLGRNTFNGLSALKILILHHNSISLIEPCSFKVVPNVEILSLKLNKLQNISFETFCGLENMWSLTLTHNKISSVSVDTFNATPSLQKIYFGNNRIQNIPNYTFCHLEHLNVVTFLSNRLHSIADEVFCRSTSLYMLYLNNNTMDLSKSDTFLNLPNLQDLGLSDNTIGTLPAGAFKNYKFLRKLNLQKCSINRISPNSFGILQYLDTLRLSENNLPCIEHDTFEGLISLQVLQLSRNLISYIEDGAFKLLRYISRLDLSYNRIKIISGDLFNSQISSTVFIDFSNNNISSVSHHAFYEINAPVQLKLENNSLTTVGPESFCAQTKTAEHFVNLMNNTLNCTCDMRWLRNNTARRDLGVNLYSTEPLSCRVKVIGQFAPTKAFVEDVDYDMFFCQVKTFPSTLSYEQVASERILCRDGCQCFNNKLSNILPRRHFELIECLSNISLQEVDFRLPPKLTHLFINNNMLNRISRHLFKETSHLLTVSLAHNRIKEVASGAFSSLSKLESLDLSYNRVQQISQQTFYNLKSLQRLYLQHNQMETIGSESFSTLRKINSLDLSSNKLKWAHFEKWQNIKWHNLKLGNNNWDCDCTFGQPFAKWIYKLGAVVQDRWNITCLQTDKEDIYDHCLDGIIIGLSTTMGFIILCLLVTMIVYCNRETLLIFLYSRFRFRLFKMKEKSKKYDAFLSYCSGDGFAKIEALSNELEKPPEHFKLCIHHKNWLPGETIAENIILSVKNSRRAIIMLSDNFVASAWCMFEFQAAHNHFLEDKTFRLLVVLSNGTVPKTDDITLNRYLKTYTYLDWTSEHFWNSLRYGMPDKGVPSRTTYGSINS